MNETTEPRQPPAPVAAWPRYRRHSLAAVAAASLAGCSDVNVTRTSAFSDLRPSGTQTGVFKAGNVAGLAFRSGTTTGVTDAQGRFTCSTGQSISFSLGTLDLGETACATLIHPAALAPSGELTDPRALDIMRLLLLVDGDRTGANGIAIPESLRSLAREWPPIDLAASDFEQELVRVVSDVASVSGGAPIVVPPRAEAFAYLEASLSCAYSGLFVNTFAAGPFAAPTDVALIIYRDATGADVFDARIKRNHPESQLYLEALGTIELKALPTLINAAFDVTGRISARYQTPDVVIGNWSNAIAQQSIDRTGSFEALRLSRDSGEYRLNGAYKVTTDFSVTVVRGFVTLALDGDTITGKSFDISAGRADSITGRRAPGSDLAELTLESTMSTATVRVVTDATGGVIGLEGAWPGIAGSALSASACRLF